MKKPFTKISAAFFGLVALAHVLRLIFHVPVIIGGITISFAVSLGGLIIPGSLAVMLWTESEAA